MKQIRYWSAVSGLALALTAGTTQASITNLLFADTFFEDDTLVEHIDADMDGIMEVGDRLRGIFTVPFLKDNGIPSGPDVPLGGISGNDELSGVFDLTVAASCTPGSLLSGACTAAAPAGGLNDYVFIPTPTFGAEIEALSPGDQLDDTTESGIGFALFTDSTAEFPGNNTACGTTGSGGTCEALVVDGNLFYTAGFGTDLDAIIVGITIPSAVVAFGQAFTPNNGLGTLNYAISVLDNYTGKGIAARDCTGICTGLDDNMIDILGSANPKGVQGAGTPYDTSGDADFSIKFVPEPGILALVGLGLLGVGVGGRRRRPSAS